MLFLVFGWSLVCEEKPLRSTRLIDICGILYTCLDFYKILLTSDFAFYIFSLCWSICISLKQERVGPHIINQYFQISHFIVYYCVSNPVKCFIAEVRRFPEFWQQWLFVFADGKICNVSQLGYLNICIDDFWIICTHRGFSAFHTRRFTHARSRGVQISETGLLASRLQQWCIFCGKS